MEAVGSAASIIGVLELSAKIAALCLQYSREVKHAKDDIERLQGGLNGLKLTLEDAHKLVDGPSGGKLQTSQHLRDQYDGCVSRLKELETSLGKNLNPGGARKAMRKIGARALKWPLESKDVEKTVKALEGYRDAVSSALIVDQTRQLLEINQKIDLSQLRIAEGAAFNSHANEHDPRCHDETRVELRRSILKWAEDPDPKCKCIYWLNGMAGTGKSTISRTVAEIFARRGELGGSFFFKRGERDRSDAKLLFTTISRQLAAGRPELAASVKSAIDENHNIADANFTEQFQQLILKPLESLDTGNGKPIVFVLDALDECGGDDKDVKLIIRQWSLLNSRTLKSSSLVRVFLTSRPELPIRLGFREIKGEYEDLALHEIPQHIIEQDIATFLETELCRIKSDYNCESGPQLELPVDWPGSNDVKALTKMASPLFIFAATVCRFIEDQETFDPRAQLKKVLEFQSSGMQNPEMARLNTTYRPVLDQMLVGNKTKAAKENIVHEFRTVVGAIVLLAEPLPIAPLARLLGVDRSVVDRRLRLLHSVLDVPTPDSPVRPFHLSFRDFLVDAEGRDANPFWIDKKATHSDLAKKCLDLLCHNNNLKKDICDLKMPGARREDIDPVVLESRLPADVQYACLYWVHHVKESSVGTSVDDDHPAFSFLKCHLLHWLEALSILGKLHESILMIDEISQIVDSVSGTEMSAFLYDARRFILTFRTAIEAAPLQVYISALIFSPFNSLVRKAFENEVPDWILAKPEVETDWSPCMQTLEGHQGIVLLVTFSPDSKLIVSASSDGAVKIWDAVTGMLQQTFTDHNGSQVLSVAFAHDSVLFASQKGSLPIEIWDATTGALQKTFDPQSRKGYDGGVFTYDSALLAVWFHRRTTIDIWDTATGTLQNSFDAIAGKNDGVSSVAFTRDSTILASGAFGGGTVRIWDRLTGNLLRTINAHDSSSVKPVTFLHDTSLLASNSRDGIIKIWDATSGTLQQSLNNESDTPMIFGSLAFSHHFNLIFHGGEYGIRVWDLNTGGCLRERLPVAYNEGIYSISLSHDSKLLVSGSNTRTVKIWDTSTTVARRNVQESPKDQLQKVSVQDFLFSPDSKLLASKLSSSGRAAQDEIWEIRDATNGDLRHDVRISGDSTEIVFSHDSKFLVHLSEKSFTVWNTTTGVSQNYKSSQWLRSTTFSYNSNLIAAAQSSGGIDIWEIGAGGTIFQLQRTLNVGDPKWHWGCVTAFSRDDKLLAVSFTDNPLDIWNLATGSFQEKFERIRPDNNPHVQVKSIAFSHDSKFLAASYWSPDIVIWDVATGATQWTFENYTRLTIFSFDSAGLYLDTNIGRVVIPQDAKAKTETDKTLPESRNWRDELKRCGYGLSIDRSWVLWDNQRIIWLPPNFRLGLGSKTPFPLASPITTPELAASSVVTIPVTCSVGWVVTMGLSASGPFSTT